MGESLRELFVNIKIGGEAHEALNTINERIEEGKNKLKEFGEAFLAAFGIEKLHAFVEEQAKLGASIKDTSEKLGIGAEALQKLGYAASIEGGSVDEMNTALRFLSRNLASAKDGSNETAQAFEKYHIQVKNADGSLRKAEDVIYDVSEVLHDMPEGPERVGLAMKLLGRSGANMIPLLSKGREEMSKLTNEADELGGVLGKDYLDAADKADDATTRMSFAWRGAKSAIAGQLFPAFTDLTNSFTKHVGGLKGMLSHTTLLRTAFLGLAGIAAAKMAPAFLSVVKAIAGVSAEAGLMETALGIGELMAIVAAVAALALVFDDLWAMFEGKDSLIGDTIDAMFGIGEAKLLVDDLTKSWENLNDTIGDLGIELPDITEVLGALLVGAAGMVRAFILYLTGAINAIGRFFEAGAFIKQKVDDLKSGKGVNAPAEMLKLGKFAEASIQEFQNTTATAFDPINNPSIDMVERKSRQRAAAASVHQENHITNHITTTGDPAAIGRAAGQGTRRGIPDLNNDNAMEAFALPAEDTD